MFNFFSTSPSQNGNFILEGENLNHLKNVLRMKVGDKVLVSYDNKNNLCEIKEITPSCAIASILEQDYLDTSLPISITLFQGLPKSDKMELIIQKSVELGVNAIVPVEMQYSVVKLIGDKKDNKIKRWQAISESAAKQSKRTCIPEVLGAMTIKKALEMAKDFDLIVVPYENENGMQATKTFLSQIKKDMKIALFIGPEGGFSKDEIALAKEQNANIISLGKRILRTETASLTALSMLMLFAEMSL